MGLAAGGAFMLVIAPVVLLLGAGNPPCPSALSPGTVNTPAGGGPVAAGMYAQPLRLEPGRWYQVGATQYGGPADPSSSDYGSIGTPGESYLPAHPDTFAELSVLDHNPANGGTFTFADANALNNLPYMTALRVANNGTQRVLYKRDVGYGQGPGQLIGNGQPYRLDVWWMSAGTLGVSKNPVDIQLAPATGSGATLGQLPANAGAAGGVATGAARLSRAPASRCLSSPAPRRRSWRPGSRPPGRTRPPPSRRWSPPATGSTANPISGVADTGRRSTRSSRGTTAQARSPTCCTPAAHSARARSSPASSPAGGSPARAIRDRLRQQRPRVHVRRRPALRHLLQRHRHRPERRPVRPALARLPHRPQLGRLVGPPPRRPLTMSQATRITARVLASLAAIVAVGGCGISDPYTHANTTTSPQHASPAAAAGPAAAQNPGESPAPPPPTAQSQAPSAPAATPEQAIRQFALLYVNWTWRTLEPHLRQLAAISVGAARLAEQQAAAAAGRDSEIAATHVYNRGQIVSIAPSQTQSGEWVIVTASRPAATPSTTGSSPPGT